MNILLTTVIAFLITLPTCAQPKRTEWHGIVLLRSTRADVNRLWGSPNADGGYYEIDNFVVHVDYSDGPCEKGKPGWNVPRDTVVSLSLSPNQTLKFSDLHINKKKLKKSMDGELPGIVYYTNDTDGITVSVSGDEVRNIYYNPTSKDNHLRCAPN
jgi:hypothetical protein